MVIIAYRVGRRVTKYSGLILGVLLTLASCNQSAQKISPIETANEIDLEMVSMFFNNLDQEQYIINPHNRTLTEVEDHVFRWVSAATSEDVHEGYEIRELRLSKTTVGSPRAYELMRHTAQGFTRLEPGRFYIQLHIVHAASDPELHGVIDAQGPKLLSFWAEGA